MNTKEAKNIFEEAIKSRNENTPPWDKLSETACEHNAQFASEILNNIYHFSQEGLIALRRIFEEAENIEDFFANASRSAEAKAYYGYWGIIEYVLGKEVKGEKALRYCQESGIKTYYTGSDIGCLRLFNGNNQLFFHNNYGDGENTIFIDDEGRFGSLASDLGEFLGLVDGEWNVSEYDCEEPKAVATIKGRFEVILIGPKVFLIEKF